MPRHNSVNPRRNAMRESFRGGTGPWQCLCGCLSSRGKPDNLSLPLHSPEYRQKNKIRRRESQSSKNFTSRTRIFFLRFVNYYHYYYANKLERIQQRFAALCFKRFFNAEVAYCYSFVLEELQLPTLRVRRHRLDAFFLTQVYSGSKS
jgi:hypothetical protein